VATIVAHRSARFDLARFPAGGVLHVETLDGRFAIMGRTLNCLIPIKVGEIDSIVVDSRVRGLP